MQNYTTLQNYTSSSCVYSMPAQYMLAHVGRLKSWRLGLVIDAKHCSSNLANGAGQSLNRWPLLSVGQRLNGFV